VRSVVFDFLKKKPIRFEKDEEIEVLLVARQDLFITRVARQSFQKIFLHLPVQVQKKQVIELDVPLIVHFTRSDLLGSFKTSVAEILADEHPPLFVISVPQDISWEEIVPARLVDRSPACLSSPPLSLALRHGGREFEGTFSCFDKETLTFFSPEELPPGERVNITLDSSSWEAEIVHSSPLEDDELFETRVSLSSLPEDMRVLLSKLVAARGKKGL
jgi:hypothetical protein